MSQRYPTALRMDSGTTSYRSLLQVPGVIPLFVVSLTSRMAGAMWMFSLTLIALNHYRSPQLAGAVGFASLAPALPIGLITGALLDRHGRRRLMAADQALSLAVTLAVLAALAAGLLSPTLLVILTALGAITLPLTQIGTRSLKPLLVPRDMWDRANGLDNAVTGGAYFAGVGIAGLLVALAGPGAPLVLIALLWLIGSVWTLAIPEPRLDRTADRTVIGLLRSAGDGLRYALRNPTLRVTTLMLPFINAAIGMSELTLTAILLQATGSPAAVGLVRSVEPLVEIGSSLIAGRLMSLGRERAILAATLVAQACLFVVVAARLSAVLVAAAAIIAAALSAPRMIAFTSLVQRNTDPALYARTTSVATILGVMGTPLGAALAGAALGISPTIALLATAALVVAPAGLTAQLKAQRATETDVSSSARDEGGPPL
jgi:predicted MFS family arabinose efflux permease